MHPCGLCAFSQPVKDRIGQRPRYGQSVLYGQCMLTIASRVDVMNRLGRAMADPTRARILLSLLEKPGYPVQLAHDLELTRSNVSNHLTCLRGCGLVVATPEGRSTRYEISDAHLTRALTVMVNVVLAVDDGAPCTDGDCDVALCCAPTSKATSNATAPATVAATVTTTG